MTAPAPESLSNRIKRLWHLWVVLGFVILILGAYASGFRPGPGLTVVRVGMLTVTDIPAGTAIYTDQASRGMSTGKSITVNLVPGSHTVIVSAPNDEPWEKIVTISSNTNTSLSPILVPKKPTPIVLGGSEALAAGTAIAGTVLPTALSPLVVGCANIYVADNRVIAAAATTSPNCATPPEYLCTDGACSPTIIYSPTTPIHGVIAFPNRSDAVIVAAGPSTNAVGLDPRYPQFFAPIIKGVNPLIGSLASTSTTTGFFLLDSRKVYFIGL